MPTALTVPAAGNTKVPPLARYRAEPDPGTGVEPSVVYQIPVTDSLGNAWSTGFGPPNVTFNLRQVGSSSDAIPYTFTWRNVDPTRPIDIQFKDTASAFELTPAVWSFTLRDDQNGNGSGPYKAMHSWQRNLLLDANNPLVFKGSSTTNPYLMKVYWHQQ